MSERPPEHLAAALADRYLLERELGQGGMATVYLAHDIKHDRKVAIKVLRPELAAVIGAERFLSEIKTTANLQHPHILPLFNSGTAGGEAVGRLGNAGDSSTAQPSNRLATEFLFYVMPFIDGESLRDRLTREKQLPIADAVRIATEVAGALDYAHRHNVIHRDIKPENILLHDGRALVADFGIALAASKAGGSRMTETGMSLGTPTYMSPEQAMGEREITARSDVYALGAMTYEMLIGEPPFTGPTAQAIVAKVMTAEPAGLRAQRKSIPPEVEAAVFTALEKLPADRFGSASAFADALANPAFATPTLSGAGGTRAPRGVSPRAFRTTAAVAAVALIAAALGWLRPAPRPELSRFAITLPDSQALQGYAIGIGNLRLALSPDGRTIVYAGVGATPGSRRLWMRPLDELSATPLPGTDGGYNPAFSPDGQRVAFIAGSPRALKSIALAGGPAVTLTDSLVDAGGVSWGHDGYIYTDGRLAGDGLMRVRETGGSPEVASMPDTAAQESWHAAPSALPNGRGVLFSIAHLRGQGEWQIGVLDTRTGKHKALVSGVQGRYAASGHLLYVTPDGTLMAAPFDQDKLEVRGPGVAVAQGLAVRGFGRSDVEVSTTGNLIYTAGPTTGRTRELVWVTRDGTVTPVDSQWSVPIVGSPALSPDGRSALVALSPGTGPTQIWVKQLDRGPAAKLANMGTSPTWTPDGKGVLFSTPTGGGRGPVDGSVLPREFKTTGVFFTPEYSPDGKWIIYSPGGLFIMRAEGDSGARALLPPGPASVSRPVISPDGRWLAYASDETGRTEVYVRPFPDVQLARHQVSTVGGLAPRWSRDGHELFFIDLSDRRNLVAVPVTLTPTFSAGIPHSLFSADPFVAPGSGFDVSPDGRRFLMTRPAGGNEKQQDELILVQNFFEALRAKATGK